MIQRKQTVFLLIAVIVTVACLCLPVGRFVPDGMGLERTMYNLWIVSPADSGVECSVWALFAIQIITLPVALTAIFMFKNRRAQARLCMFNTLLCIGWYAVYAAFALTLGRDEHFRLSFAACLPLVSAILYLLARKGILDDERLVRAADRIR